MIKIVNLKKHFKKVKAIDDISLSITRGEVFGLLGPNGAGKTTIINILSTLLRPTSGTATVSGLDVIREKDKVRRKIGIVFQDFSLDSYFTAFENLDFHGRIYNVTKCQRLENIKELLELVQLEDKKGVLVKNFSSGMKRRLEIARCFLHRPYILFLDEPTIGLDPQTRRRIWGFIKKLNREKGVTIVLTTHYMEEADILCNRIGIIDKGRIVAIDRPESLKKSIGGDVITICTEDGFIPKADWIKQTSKYHGHIKFTVDNGEERIHLLVKMAQEKGVGISSLAFHKPTLEDVFLHYTGRNIHDEEDNV